MLPSPSRLRPTDARLPLERAPYPALSPTRFIPREVRVAVLLNAHAKRVNRKVRERLASIVPREDLFFAETIDDAAAFAECILARRYDTLMVGGGDGTLTTTMNMLVRAANAMARGNTRHTLPDIGILRLGTGNGLANVTGAGDYLRDATRLVEGERPEKLPLRLVEDRESGWAFPFASMGYDAQVLNDYVAVCEGARTSWGRAMAKSLPGYFYAIGTRTLPAEFRAERARVRVVARGTSSMIDPETREEVPLERNAVLFEGPVRAVLAGTTPYYGFGLKVLPFARRRTDRFHLRISTAPIGHLLSHLPSVWRGTLRSPHLLDFLSEGVSIESSIPLPFQMSGDARGHTDRLELGLSERAFRLIQGTGRPS